MAAVGLESRIWESLRDRLAALTLTPALLIAWPRVPFPAEGAEKPDVYLQAHQLRAEPVPVGISGWGERIGTLQVDVVYKPQDGIVRPTEIADAVAAWFPRNLRLTNSGVVVHVSGEPFVASPLNDDPYVRIPVSIRYRSFNE